MALLRGINVGGNNLIPMAELRAAVAATGARDVATYIQSGNVLFDGAGRDAASWSATLEATLAERFGLPLRVVVRSHADLRAIVDGAPAGFGAEPDRFRSDVMFLRPPAAPDEVVGALVPKAGVDRLAAGDSVVYFERLAARAAQSALSKIIGLPVYQHLTIRNWRTTTRLLAMLDERGR